MTSVDHRIAQELAVKPAQVIAAIKLLDEGSTVPFIARYRKEITGNLDDTQLRFLSERLQYFRELDDRRATILKVIKEQGKLTPSLNDAINNADTKTRLEDLYLPYKTKRQTKGQIAIAAGLKPLADALQNELQLNPTVVAEGYLNTDKNIQTAQEALDGAKYILMERFAENAELLALLRTRIQNEGLLSASVIAGKENEGQKFRDYFDYQEAINKVPSHRALAILRGRREGFLSIKLDLTSDPEITVHPCESTIANFFELPIYTTATEAAKWLAGVVRWTWKIKLHMHIESDLLADLRASADATAISVFADNLGDLLLAPPAGQRPTIGLDPGLRTGVKVAVIDATGTYVAHDTIYPHAPKNNWDGAINTLAQLAKKYGAELLAIGNGTASRETEKLAADLIKRHPELNLTPALVSESGASIYSASELAAKEFPNLDVTIRGAVSIARRLQDPLAELVKLEPKSIGVGQYQHDVSQHRLSRSLEAVVEDCVNAVGVEVNTASTELLARVAGISTTLASNIVQWRSENGPIKNRNDLKLIPRMGDKSFEQCAGFLRVQQSDNPLDNSSVHPESYPIVEQMAAQQTCALHQLIGNKDRLSSLNIKNFYTEEAGESTLIDILAELEKPGRDPRPQFTTAHFKEGVEKISDLQLNMVLEGVVSNVTHFGAFVDIGVHQDGLVHISALADKFVKDPRDVVKTGQVVTVKVLKVDPQRKRIALSMRLNDNAEAKDAKSTPVKTGAPSKTRSKPSNRAEPTSAFAAAFASAKKR